MPAEPVWTGRLFFGPEWLLYAGPVAPTEMHAHHALQLIVGVDDVVTMRGASGRTHTHRAAMIPSRVEHAIAEGTTRALVLHVPPEKPAGRRLSAMRVDGDAIGAWRLEGAAAALTSRALPTTWDEAVACVGMLLDDARDGSAPPRGRHPVIARLLEILPQLVADDDVSASGLAARCQVSVGRLSHLFKDEVGTPLRPFILWLRLQIVGQCLYAGASLTHAAHAAGFHDSAHLSRVFKRSFGLTPSAMLGHVQWVLPPGTP